MSSFVAVGDTLSTAYKSPAAAPPRPPPLDMVLSFTNSSKRLSTCQRHLAGLLDCDACPPWRASRNCSIVINHHHHITVFRASCAHAVPRLDAIRETLLSLCYPSRLGIHRIAGSSSTPCPSGAGASIVGADGRR